MHAYMHVSMYACVHVCNAWNVCVRVCMVQQCVLVRNVRTVCMHATYVLCVMYVLYVM